MGAKETIPNSGKHAVIHILHAVCVMSSVHVRGDQESIARRKRTDTGADRVNRRDPEIGEHNVWNHPPKRQGNHKAWQEDWCMPNNDHIHKMHTCARQCIHSDFGPASHFVIMVLFMHEIGIALVKRQMGEEEQEVTHPVVSNQTSNIAKCSVCCPHSFFVGTQKQTAPKPNRGPTQGLPSVLRNRHSSCFFGQSKTSH